MKFVSNAGTDRVVDLVRPWLKTNPSMASACPGLISGTFQVSIRESGASSISHVLSARLGKTAFFNKLGPSTLAVCAGTLRLARSAGSASVADSSSTNSVCGFCHFTRVALPSRYSGRSRSKLLQPWCANVFRLNGAAVVANN